MCNTGMTDQCAIGLSLILQGQTVHCFKFGYIWCNLFSKNSSHSACHSSNIYLVGRNFKNVESIIVLHKAQNIRILFSSNNYCTKNVSWCRFIHLLSVTLTQNYNTNIKKKSHHVSHQSSSQKSKTTATKTKTLKQLTDGYQRGLHA